MEVTIKSGFNRSASVFSFEKGEFKKIASVCDCTWVGDPCQEKTVEVEKGAVLWHNRQHGNSVTLVGDWEGFEVPDGLLLFSWSQYTQGWYPVIHQGDWVQGVLTDSLMTIAQVAAENGVYALGNGSFAVELPKSEEFLVISPEGETEIWSGPYNSPLYVSLEGELTCGEWEAHKQSQKYWSLRDRWEEKISRALQSPRDLEGAIKKFPDEVREIVKDLAAEWWPISCGGARPTLAP